MGLSPVIESIVSASSSVSADVDWAILPSPIVKTAGRLFICSNPHLPSSLPPSLSGASTPAAFLEISSRGEFAPSSTQQPADHNNCNHLRLEVPEGKRGQLQFLKNILPQSMSFISHHLRIGSRICISCDTGKDISVGVALAALQKFFDDTGGLISGDSVRASRTYLGVLGTYSILIKLLI